jgi:hypothetical protein
METSIEFDQEDLTFTVNGKALDPTKEHNFIYDLPHGMAISLRDGLENNYQNHRYLSNITSIRWGFENDQKEKLVELQSSIHSDKIAVKIKDIHMLGGEPSQRRSSKMISLYIPSKNSPDYVFDKSDVEMLIASFDTKEDWGIIRLIHENLDNPINLEAIGDYLSSNYVLSTAHYQIDRSDFKIDVADSDGNDKDFDQAAYDRAISDRKNHIKNSQEDLDKARLRIQLLNIDEKVLEGLFISYTGFNELESEIKLLNKHKDSAPELWEKFENILSSSAEEGFGLPAKNINTRENGISL